MSRHVAGAVKGGRWGGGWGGRAGGFADLRTGMVLTLACLFLAVMMLPAAMSARASVSIGAAGASALGSSVLTAGPEAKGERRVGALVSAGTAVAASGRLTEPALLALNRPLVSMNNLGANERFRSLELQIGSTAANGSTGFTNVYQVKRGTPPTSDGTPDVNLRYIGRIDYVISSATGSGPGAVFDSTHRIASTLQWTPATQGTTPPGIDGYLTSAYRGAGVIVYSPGGTTPAAIQFTDVGNAEWLLFDPGTTSGQTLVLVAECGT